MRAEQPAPASFRGFGLPEAVVDALERDGITVPTAIQARTLPDALAGRDVLGRAQTGSGKTLGFGVPLLAVLAGGPRAAAGRPRGLVLVPTRELAEQVRQALEPLARSVGRRVLAVYGGAGIVPQIESLGRGVDVVVATPGRLEDLVGRDACHLDDVQVTVIDEADHMADLGFLPAVTRLVDRVPAGTQRVLFSATLDRGVDALVRRYLVDPAVHAVAAPVATVDTMDHLGFVVEDSAKVEVLTDVLRRDGRTLVFVRTKHGADRLVRKLARADVAAAAIHGNRSQPQRQRALRDFSDGRVPVLVATDVAARGIHVDDVDLVVHHDPPADHKDYLHRSGRTARAGARGTVLSIVLPGERADAARMHDRLGTGLTFVPVSPGDGPVRELAGSGTPIVVVERPEVTQPSSGSAGRRTTPRQVPRQGARPAPRPGSGQDGSPRSDRGSGRPRRRRPRGPRRDER